MRFDIHDHFQVDKDFTTQNIRGGTIAFDMDFGVTAGGVGIDSESSMGWEFEHKSTFIQTQSSSRVTSASFVLADSNAGDYFDVEVFRDLRFGTFAFNTTAGQSRCPVQPGTNPREDPRLERRPGDSLAPLAHPDFPIYVHLAINNRASVGSATYELAADLKQLNDSTRIYADGQPLTEPVVFEDLDHGSWPGPSWLVHVDVETGHALFEAAFDAKAQPDFLVVMATYGWVSPVVVAKALASDTFTPQERAVLGATWRRHGSFLISSPLERVVESEVPAKTEFVMDLLQPEPRDVAVAAAHLFNRAAMAMPVHIDLDDNYVVEVHARRSVLETLVVLSRAANLDEPLALRAFAWPVTLRDVASRAVGEGVDVWTHAVVPPPPPLPAPDGRT